MDEDALKPVAVDLEELVMAMGEAKNHGVECYLDTTTGEVITLVDPEIVGHYPETDALRQQIADDVAGRFLSIPFLQIHGEYDLMLEFAESVQELRLKGRLLIALDGKGAFKRFKNVLRYEASDHERDRWFRMRDALHREHAIEWLRDEGFRPEVVSSK